MAELELITKRGEVQLQTRFKKFIWIEDMVELVESCASTEVYSVLKRVDEKHVTERGFTNPKFVEDVVRDIATKLKKDSNITWFSVSAENFESIHNHSAYAHTTSQKRDLLTYCLAASRIFAMMPAMGFPGVLTNATNRYGSPLLFSM